MGCLFTISQGTSGTNEHVIRNNLSSSIARYRITLHLNQYLGDEMDIDEREDCRSRLEKVVKVVGEQLLSYTGDVEDMGDIMDHGHDISTVDEEARNTMACALEAEFPDRDLTLQFELHPYKIKSQMHPKEPLHFVIDEIDGTTNFKRWAASSRTYRPHAAVCIAAFSSMSLESLQVGVIFTLDEQEVHSGIRLTSEFGRFRAYRNGTPLVIPSSKQGDKTNRVLVIGYSSKVRIRKAEIEKAICSLTSEAGKEKRNYRVYEGCRSSTMDIVSIIRNQYDAYIDSRAVFGDETETRLETYDVAAVLPTAYGCNLLISDIYGRPLTEYNWDDPLPLLVARPEVYNQLCDTIVELSEKGGIIPDYKEWRHILEKDRKERQKK